jgi:inner membrane protein
MASLFSHAVAALGIGAAFYQPGFPRRAWAMGTACAIVPDLDVIGFRFGVHYGDFWGHRGFTHSLVFAVILALLPTVIAFPLNTSYDRRILWLYLFLAASSHGLLDAVTDGGLGVAFLSPFDLTRYFFPWRPVLVSPIGVGRFFSVRGAAVLRTEIVWIWLPSAFLAAFAFLLRRGRPARSS